MYSFFLTHGPMLLLKTAPPGGEGASPLTTFAPLIIIIGIFYFLIIRPQSRKQKDTQRMLSALKKGDRVVTIGGIHGVIQTVKEATLIVKVDENTKLEFNRGAIASVSSPAKEEKEDKKLEEKKGDSSETE